MKYALVTGAAGTVGLATASALIKDGWFVFCADIDRERLDHVKAYLPEDRARYLTLDVRNEADWSAAVSAVSSMTNDRLDLLVNNAAIFVIKTLRETTLQQSRDLIDINLLGIINGIKSFLPLLETTPGATIINVGSITGQVGFPMAAVYSATKAAIKNLTEVLSIELKDADIAVRVVLPSFVMPYRSPDNTASALNAHLKRFGISYTDPRRVAAAVVKAASGRKIHYVVGSQARQYLWLAYLWPAAVRFINGRIGRSFQNQIGRASRS